MNKITLIGIDTAKRCFTWWALIGTATMYGASRSARRKLLSTLAQLEPCKVVLEACGASHHWARQINACGTRCALDCAAACKAVSARSEERLPGCRGDHLGGVVTGDALCRD